MSSNSSSSSSAAAIAEQPVKMKNMNSMKMKNLNGNTVRNSSGRMPSAEDLIKHYESQGMDTQQASVKVINDLQKALLRLITTKPHQQQQQQQQMDMIKGRLLTIESKLDTKPGYPQILGLGVASAAGFKGLETWLFPQVANIWNNAFCSN